MDNILLALSIISGQLIKIPLGGSGGLTLIDAVLIIFCFWGLVITKIKLKKPPFWIISSLLFITVSVLSLGFTPVKLTIAQYLTSFSYTIRFILYILFGWLVYSGAFPSIGIGAHKILAYTGISLGLIGIIQLIFLPDLRFLQQYGWDPHFFRAASTFLDPNFLGSFLVLTLIIWFQKFKSIKKGYFWGFALIYLSLLVTFSRGSYLAFLISFLIFSILDKSIKKILLTIILFVGLLLGFKLYSILVAEPRGIDRTQSAQFRETTWQQGWNLFLASPILGVGFNTYRFALKQYNLADDTFLQSHGSTTNDSSLLYILATTGVLGITTYLYFLFILVKSGWKEKMMPAAIAGLLAQSLFANTFFYPPILIWIILVAARKK